MKGVLMKKSVGLVVLVLVLLGLREALADPQLPLYACGDWVHETRPDRGVQGALLSGMAAAGLLLGRPGPKRETIPEDFFMQISS